MWDASIANHAKYLDDSTGFFADMYLEKRNCPSCNQDRLRDLFRKSGGVYVACESCSMIFLNPAFKDSALEDYYRHNHDVQSAIVASDASFYRNLYLTGLTQISKLIAGNAGKRNILDVGCSAGAFLNIAKESGWDTYGLELNSKEIEIARNSGHNVQASIISGAKFDIKFEAITLWDVFEHIKDGYKFLSDAKRLLNPDGVIFIQSPSADALAARVLQEKCNMFDGLEHVNIYGEKQLSRLADRVGLKLAHFSTVISEIGVINNYLDYEDPYLGGTTNTQSIFGMVDTASILEKNLGYKFQACLVAR
jgi:SAM-dependent methyltransferase